MTCEFCDDTGWEVSERGAKRCRHIKAKPAETCTPITPVAVASAVKALNVLAFFPRDEPSQIIIGDALAAMCPSVESLRYVVRRAAALYRSWDKCGVPGLRQIVCSRYPPADGIEAGPTESFPEGLPSDSPPPALPAGARKMLPPGHEVSADPELEESIRQLAAKCKMPPPHPIASKFARMLRDLMSAPNERDPEDDPPPNPNFKPITQADVDRAVQELHEKKARAAEEALTEKIVNIR